MPLFVRVPLCVSSARVGFRGALAPAARVRVEERRVS